MLTLQVRGKPRTKKRVHIKHINFCFRLRQKFGYKSENPTIIVCIYANWVSIPKKITNMNKIIIQEDVEVTKLIV